MSVRLFVSMVFSAGIAAAAAEPPPEIPIATMPTVKCVYRILKSSGAVQSVDAYAIDGFRSAIEYTFRDKNGHQVISDIMLSGRHYSFPIQHDESQVVVAQDMDFASRISDRLSSECHVSPAFDNLLPSPKVRADWRRVDLPDHSP